MTVNIQKHISEIEEIIILPQTWKNNYKTPLKFQKSRKITILTRAFYVAINENCLLNQFEIS